MDNSLTSVSAEDDYTKKADEPDPAPEPKTLSWKRMKQKQLMKFQFNNLEKSELSK